MNLDDRLRRVLGTGAANTVSRRALDLRQANHRSIPATSLEAAVGGAWERDGSSRSFVVERVLGADEIVGGVRIGAYAAELARSLSRVSLFTRNRSARPPLVFFDLETTGLSGGAGTYAFLVGCGWFDGGAFIMRQHLLTDFDQERPMLDAVALELGRAGVLVSFNGKSFDAPVLETRYQMHRLEWIGATLPHFDVLHPARRFWGGTSAEAGCSLGTLERRLAGVRRDNDVPGCEIPARYFDFVRTGDGSGLAGVLEHNRQDLVSLAIVATRLLRLVEDGAETTDDPQEALAIGGLYVAAGQQGRAREAYQRAVDLSPSMPGGDGTLVTALRALAVAERRARDFDAAAASWQRLLDLPGCPSNVAGEAATALAIHHEHRKRDLRKAKGFALRSLANDVRASSYDAVHHRLARLDRKLERAIEPPLFPSLSSQPFSDSPMSGRQTSS